MKLNRVTASGDVTSLLEGEWFNQLGSVNSAHPNHCLTAIYNAQLARAEHRRDGVGDAEEPVVLPDDFHPPCTNGRPLTKLTKSGGKV